RGPPGHRTIPRPRSRWRRNHPEAHASPGGRQSRGTYHRGRAARLNEAPSMSPEVQFLLTVVGIVVAVLIVLVFLFRLSWRVAEPDEALIISGLRASGPPQGAGESMGFRIVTGRGALVMPGVVKVRTLSL